MIREEVAAFAQLGPLPDEDAEAEVIDQHAAVLESIARPVSEEEARILVTLFGPDGCYGLAWTLLHLIETAPGWPLEELLLNDGNEWVQLLWQRVENARRRGE